MAEKNDVIDLCNGQRSEASGPPVKRFRGVTAGETSNVLGGPSGSEQGAFPMEEPSAGPPQPVPSPSLFGGRGSRHVRLLNPPRLGSDEVSLNEGLWGQAQPMLDESASPIDLAPGNHPPPPVPLHWARKSQRQNRSSLRQQVTTDNPPEQPFPPRLTPFAPYDFRGPPEPPRIPDLMHGRRGGGERSGREGQQMGPRGQRRMGLGYPFDLDMDDIDIFDGVDGMEARDIGQNRVVGQSLVGPGLEEPSASAMMGRRLRFGHPSREQDSLRSLMTRDELPGDLDGLPAAERAERVAMRERIRQLESRRAALEMAREQSYQQLQQTRDAFMRRSRRGQNRERQGYLREEFGALMNVLGLVSPGEGGAGNAVMGITRAGLPPHLLFTDRDFTGDDYEWLCRLDEGLENRKGADDTIINKVPVAEFEPEVPAQQLEADPVRCPICLEEFSKGDSMRLMPCSHKYHKECLDKWLKIKAVCPICNFNIKEGDGDDFE